MATPVKRGGIGGQGICDNILARKNILRNTALMAYNTVKLGPFTISERFAGLQHEQPKKTLGLEDNLYGKPSNPLTLKENFDDRQNVYIKKKCRKPGVFDGKKQCTLDLKGRGPAGFQGFGSLALLFDKDQSNIRLRFTSKGTANMVAMIYARSGRELGILQINVLEAKEYAFSHRPGKIAGVAVWPTGENINWHGYSLIGVCLGDE